MHYDVITIGSGGGSKIARPAWLLGLKVAMVENGFDVQSQNGNPTEWKRGLGGTCLNRGCIPSKMLIHPADVLTEVDEGRRLFGLDVPEPKAGQARLDFADLVDRTSAFVDKDSEDVYDAYAKAMRSQAEGGVQTHRDLYAGKAAFVGERLLEVTLRDVAVDSKAFKAGGKWQPPGQLITADTIFLAVGAEPAVPPIPGLEGTPFLTSTEVLRNKQLPKKVIVIGAGYIAVELGHMLAACGSEMHMFARSELLRAMDKDAREEFARVFTERYPHVHTGVDFVKVDYTAGAFTLHYRSRSLGTEAPVEAVTADQLLVCTGVAPSGPSLSPERSGVRYRPGSTFLQVDDRLRTDCPGVYAFGDCIGNYLFRHCANYEGEYLLQHVIYPLAKQRGLLQHLPLDVQAEVPDGGEPPAVDYAIGMPWAVFSSPQVAGVGTSEDELLAQGLVKDQDYVVGINYYKNSGMGDARRSDHGLVKLLVATSDLRLLGCVIVGYEASTLVHNVTPVFAQGGTLTDQLSRQIYVHPALNEIVKGACRKARDRLVQVGATVPLRLRLS